MKTKKTKEQLLREDISEIIYFVLTRWDMNSMTKGFAKLLARDIVKLVSERAAYWL